MNIPFMMIPLSTDVFRASMGINPSLWERWYLREGFVADLMTNLLRRDGKLWRVNREAQRLESLSNQEETALRESLTASRAMYNETQALTQHQTGTTMNIVNVSKTAMIDALSRALKNSNAIRINDIALMAQGPETGVESMPTMTVSQLRIANPTTLAEQLKVSPIKITKSSVVEYVLSLVPEGTELVEEAPKAKHGFGSFGKAHAAAGDNALLTALFVSATAFMKERGVTLEFNAAGNSAQLTLPLIQSEEGWTLTCAPVTFPCRHVFSEDRLVSFHLGLYHLKCEAGFTGETFNNAILRCFNLL
jgi:hypothetical protein